MGLFETLGKHHVGPPVKEKPRTINLDNLAKDPNKLSFEEMLELSELVHFGWTYEVNCNVESYIARVAKDKEIYVNLQRTLGIFVDKYGIYVTSGDSNPQTLGSEEYSSGANKVAIRKRIELVEHSRKLEKETALRRCKDLLEERKRNRGYSR